MIKYRDKNGNVHEIEGDLFICQDKNGNEVFADDNITIIDWPSGDRVPCIVRYDKDECAFRADAKDSRFLAHNIYDRDVELIVEE